MLVRELLYLPLLLCGRCAHLSAWFERVTCHTRTHKCKLVFLGEDADLLGLLVNVHGFIDTVQSTNKPHLPPSFWEGAELSVSPIQTKHIAVLRKILGTFYCELEVLTSSSTASHFGIKKFLF